MSENPQKRPIKGLLIVAALLASTVPFQLGIIGIRGEFRSIQDTLYLTSSTLRRISFGYTELMADIYWLRVLQYFGSTKQVEQDADLLYHYFDIITDLDPKFLNAYRYGGTFLADEPPIGLGSVDLGIKLMDKGRENLPDNYQIPMEEAFLFLLYAKDYEKAAELFDIASEQPGISDYRRSIFKGMAALAHTRGGDRELARQVWTYIYENSDNEGRRNFAFENIKELNTRDIEDKLTEALFIFKDRYGRFPQRLAGLQRAGIVKYIPEDPYEEKFVFVRRIKKVKSLGLATKDLDFNVQVLTARAYRFKREIGRLPYDMAELRAFIAADPKIEFPEHPFGRRYGYDPETGEVTKRFEKKAKTPQ